MNANLKELMRSAGYPATEGANWGASDTKTFQGFAVRELGVPLSQTSSMLAYPAAFPAAMDRLSKMSGVVPEPAAAPIVPQTVAEAVQATFAPEPEPVPATAPVNESEETSIDVTPQGQTAKQELEQPVAPPPESDEEEVGAEEEGGTEEGSDEEPPADAGDESDEFTEGADETTDEGDAADEAADEATEE